MVGWRHAPEHHTTGAAVVCVHGAGVSSRELRPLVARLGEHLPAWTVDLPGFGRSTKPDRLLGLPELADALAEWLAAESLPPAVLLGCSFGCQIAVEVAVRHPDQVAGMILVGPTVDPRIRSWGPLLGRWLANGTREHPRMAPLNLADYWEAGPRRVLGAFSEAMRDRVEDKLPSITVPTLVIRGEYDRLVSQPWAEDVTRLLPRGRLRVLPDLPHMIPFRDPDALVPHVTEFLARLPSEVTDGPA